MKKLVIFDLDGTLSNNINQSRIIYERLSERYKLKKLSIEEIRELKTNPSIKRLVRLGIPIHKIPSMYKESRVIASEFVDDCRIVSGLSELIINLSNHHVKLAIVSSNSISNINKILANNGINVFTFIEGKAKMKGKRRKLQKLIRQSGCELADAIYIGDEVRDVSACKSIALEVIAVTWGFETKTTLENAGPNYIVDTADELSKLLFI
jgi:phosphoglycolate phosphatase